MITNFTIVSTDAVFAFEYNGFTFEFDTEEEMKAWISDCSNSELDDIINNENVESTDQNENN